MRTKKTYTNYTKEEMVDSFVFENNLSISEIEEAANELQNAREKNKKQLTEKQQLLAKVMQLRFLMEDYISSNSYVQEKSFSSFLKKYITINYTNSKNFADDIQITETELNSFINKSSIPSKKIIVRLELHSNNAIPALYWYKLLEKENENDLQMDQAIRNQEMKFVKNRLIFE